MSGEGQPALDLDGQGLDVVIVTGTWHTEIAAGLLAGAERVLTASGARYRVIEVPGSFELPVVCQAALNAGADAVVALGVIIRGETPHFDFVADAATSGLTRVSLDSGKPVGFGVLTVDNQEQGYARAGFPDSQEDVGGRAAEAALAAALATQALRSLPEAPLPGIGTEHR